MAASDTIYAFATPPGRSGVAVLRLSGDRAADVIGHVVGGTCPPPRRAVTRMVHDAQSRDPIDQALVLWMPGPNSFTGEDVLEIHTHGGAAIRSSMLSALSRIDGLRPAEPGEFVRRAFLAGRLDLSEAEGLADLIDAETEVQRRQALFQAKGSFRAKLDRWREELLSASALIEASLDFSDEELPDDLAAHCASLLAEVEADMMRALSEAASGEIVRDGFRVVLTGPPNAGKSTLLNRLAQRDIAIVSPLPGTTRDVIEVRCDIGGHLVVFLDTAGLRESDDPVERIGIERARQAAASADLRLILHDSSSVEPANSFAAGQRTDLLVWTKIDLCADRSSLPCGALALSAATGEGLDMLLTRIANEAGNRIGSPDALMVRAHQVHGAKEAADALARARKALADGQDVLVAEDVRLALRALAGMSGRAGVEDVLDRVFGRFCIGK